MDKNEPKHYRPKLLAFKESRDLYDCNMIKRDLEFAKSCFDQISENEYGVSFASQDFISNKKGSLDWCTFVTGAIYYRRCFKSGVRICLSRDEVVGALADDQLSLHDALIDITDKHVAHSVNEMELGCTTIDVSIDNEGHVHRGGIGWRGAGIGPFGPAGYRAFCLIVATIVDGPLNGKIAALEKAVHDRAALMTDAEIMQLPDGFTPFIDTPQFKRPRTWPPRAD